jgi:hypothetical protein
MSTTMRDLLASLVRTGVPYLVGLALTYLAATFDFVLSDTTSAVVMTNAALIAGTLYYAAVRAAETRWPAVGVLLGWKIQLQYQPTAAVARNERGITAWPGWVYVAIGLLAVLGVLWLLGIRFDVTVR